MIGWLFSTTIGKWIAGGAVALLIASWPAAYLKGRWDNDSGWRQQIAAERAAHAEKIEKATAVADMQRALDANVIAALEAKTEELRDALQEADRICFSGPDADRLRHLWQR